MGLVGLATLTTRQGASKTGLRKVISASIIHMILLLSKEYTLLAWIGNQPAQLTVSLETLESATTNPGRLSPI